MLHLIQNVIVLAALVWAVCAAVFVAHGVFADCADCQVGDDL